MDNSAFVKMVTGSLHNINERYLIQDRRFVPLRGYYYDGALLKGVLILWCLLGAWLYDRDFDPDPKSQLHVSITEIADG